VAGSARMQAVLDRLPAACQYGAGLLGVLASEAAWNSGVTIGTSSTLLAGIADRMAAALAG
jgi:hypothetical protein